MQSAHSPNNSTSDPDAAAPSEDFEDAEGIPYFSYASPDDHRLKRLAIAAIEKATGQPKLKRLYMENRRSPRAEETFWEAAVRQLKLNVQFNEDALGKIPSHGPVVIVANHPFGVLDGIVISYLTSKARSDFHVLTNSVLYRAPEIRPFLLPIDFAETRDAQRTNLESRAKARAILKGGGCIVAFPGGTVSTARRPFGKAMDPDWKPFTARLIMEAKATVVPVYFAGQNSHLFQLASMVSYTARLSLLFKEIARRIGDDIALRIGNPIPYTDLQHITDRKELCNYLRDLTYAMGAMTPKPKRRRLLRRRRS